MRAIKNLKTNYDDKAFVAFLNELLKESDRAAVILGHAQLDISLYRLFIKVLKPSPTTKDELFENNGPLSSSYSKIIFAYRLGLIDTDQEKALNLIRKIRNRFAHESLGCNLNSGANRSNIEEMSRLFHMDIKRLGESILGLDPKTNYGSLFRAVVATMEVLLETMIENMNPIYMKDKKSS